MIVSLVFMSPLRRTTLCHWLPAILFHMLSVAATVVFAVLPAVTRGLPGRAIFLGGFFGVVAYATYDLTNLGKMRP
jgi:uncharacterized membrane protein